MSHLQEGGKREGEGDILNTTQPPSAFSDPLLLRSSSLVSDREGNRDALDNYEREESHD